MVEKKICVVLSTVSIIPLHQNDLLRHEFALFNRTEPDNISQTGVRFLVAVGDTHTTTDTDVETCELPVCVDDGNESEIVSKHVYVICRWHCNGYFELTEKAFSQGSGQQLIEVYCNRTFRGK
jgi:hypothetical protein